MKSITGSRVSVKILLLFRQGFQVSLQDGQPVELDAVASAPGLIQSVEHAEQVKFRRTLVGHLVCVHRAAAVLALHLAAESVSGAETVTGVPNALLSDTLSAQKISLSMMVSWVSGTIIQSFSGTGAVLLDL